MLWSQHQTRLWGPILDAYLQALSSSLFGALFEAKNTARQPDIERLVASWPEAIVCLWHVLTRWVHLVRKMIHHSLYLAASNDRLMIGVCIGMVWLNWNSMVVTSTIIRANSTQLNSIQLSSSALRYFYLYHHTHLGNQRRKTVCSLWFG